MAYNKKQIFGALDKSTTDISFITEQILEDLTEVKLLNQKKAVENIQNLSELDLASQKQECDNLIEFVSNYKNLIYAEERRRLANQKMNQLEKCEQKTDERKRKWDGKMKSRLFENGKSKSDFVNKFADLDIGKKYD